MNKEKKYQEGYAQGYEDAVKTEMMYKEKEKQELLLGLVSVANKGEELIPHKDYEIKQDGEQFYLVKKKKEYPKTYEECCEALRIGIHGHYAVGYKSNTLSIFQNLLICRDAYWKIAGEEMGLGKPWEPDFTNDKELKFCIGVSEGKIQRFCCSVAQYILAFPTEEMLDAFYKNFGPDLDKCKELI